MGFHGGTMLSFLRTGYGLPTQGFVALLNLRLELRGIYWREQPAVRRCHRMAIPMTKR